MSFGDVTDGTSTVVQSLPDIISGIQSIDGSGNNNQKREPRMSFGDVSDGTSTVVQLLPDIISGIQSIDGNVNIN